MRGAWWLVAALGGCDFVVPGVAIDASSGDLPQVLVDLAQPDLIPPPPPPPDLALPLPRSCTEVLQRNPAAPSALYPIDPGGLPTGAPPLSIYCDMTDEGGGWNLVMRTIYDYAETSTLIGPYATVYSDVIGTPSAGRAYRLPVKYWPTLNATGNHLLVHYPRATDGTTCQPLAYRGSGAAWSANPPDGGARIPNLANTTSSVSIFNGNELDTSDEGMYSTCVNNYASVPWAYGPGCCYTCPSWGNGPPGHPGATYSSVSGDVKGHTAYDACGAKSPLFENSMVSDSVQEYYVR